MDQAPRQVKHEPVTIYDDGYNDGYKLHYRMINEYRALRTRTNVTGDILSNPSGNRGILAQQPMSYESK